MPCSTFQSLAIRTWWRMYNNFNTPISLREDAITSLNLQDIYNLLQKDIRVIDFSPKVESNITGADWEWWFLSKSGVFGAAVQAKKLDKKQKYDVGYIPPSNKYPQIERLLDYSIKNSISPMYCFYNWFPTMPSGVNWPCKSFPQSDDLWGCAVADAWSVYTHHLHGVYSANTYLGFSEPWHCMTCCQPAGNNISDRAFNVVNRLISRGMDSAPDVYPTTYKQKDIPRPQIHKSLPDRVIKMIQMDGSENTEYLADEFDGNLPKRLILLGDINLYS